MSHTVAKAEAAAAAAPLTGVAKRNFYLLSGGYWVSAVGNRVYDVALMWWLSQQPGGNALIGVLAFLLTLPGAFGAMMGAWTDRHSPRPVMAVANLVQGTCVACCLLLLRPATAAAVVVLATVAAWFAQVDRMAFMSLFPRLFPTEVYRRWTRQMMTANALISLVSQFAAGVLMLWMSAAGWFGVNALTFAAVAMSLALVRMPAPQPHLRQPDNDGGESANKRTLASAFRQYVDDAREGWRVIRQDPLVRRIVFTLSCTGLMVPINYYLSLYVRDALHQGPAVFGTITAAIAGGMLMGTLTGTRVTRWVIGKFGRDRMLLLNFVAFSLPSVVLGFVRSVPAAILILLLCGAFIAYQSMTVPPYVMERIQPQHAGKVFGTLVSLESLSNILFSAAFAALIVYVPVALLMSMSGTLMLLCVLVLWLPAVREKVQPSM